MTSYEQFYFQSYFFTRYFISECLKDIAGKWVVEKVDVSNLPAQMAAQQKVMMEKGLIKPLTNSTFEFRADHYFYLSPNIIDRPKDDFWEYNMAESKLLYRNIKTTKV